MSAVAAPAIFNAEQSLAALVSRAYAVYRAALGLLPEFVRRGDEDQARYLAALSDAGATFAPDLAMAARFASVPRETERLPSSLPRLVRALEDGFAVFSGIHDSSDLETAVGVLPSQTEIDALFDVSVSDWVAARGVGIGKA